MYSKLENTTEKIQNHTSSKEEKVLSQPETTFTTLVLKIYKIYIVI